jgi:hypothetical protein
MTAMVLPSAAKLLELCDAGRRALPIERSLLLLRAVCPHAQAVEGWPLGSVNARLLELRAAMFEPHWQCIADCPACGSPTDVNLDLDSMTRAVGDASGEEARRAEGTGWSITYRLPTIGDVLRVIKSRDTARAQLQQAVVLAVIRDGEHVTSDSLTEQMHVALDRAIEDADPLAAIDVCIECPCCALHWKESLNVIDLLWTEWVAASRRLVGEVARLASAFGWSESEILAMTASRRQQYLELIRHQ